MQELHNDHLGMVRMKGVARSYFWYPGIDKDIEMEVNGCEACQTFRADPPSAPLRPWKTPSMPWERIHLDFGQINGVNILVVIDSGTKWLEAFIMNTTTAEKTVEVLRGLFARHGLPKEVVSDNGPQFTSSEFENFLKGNRVKHTLVPAYHPASNGAAEKSVQTVKSALKKYLFTEYGGMKTSMQQKLDNFLLTYRTTPQTTTQCTPSSLFYKRDMRTRFTLLRPDLQSEIEDKQSKQQYYHDQKKTRLTEFSRDENVRIRNYIQGQPKWSLAKVLQRIGEYTYLVQTGNRKRKVHVEQMLKVGLSQDKDTNENDSPPTTSIHLPSTSQASMEAPPEEPQELNGTDEEPTVNQPGNISVPLNPLDENTAPVQASKSKSKCSLRRSTRIRKAPSRFSP